MYIYLTYDFFSSCRYGISFIRFNLTIAQPSICKQKVERKTKYIFKLKLFLFKRLLAVGSLVHDDDDDDDYDDDDVEEILVALPCWHFVQHLRGMPAGESFSQPAKTESAQPGLFSDAVR